MSTEGPGCIPIAYKIVASQTISQRLRKYKGMLEDELAKEERDDEWVEERFQIIEETQATLDYINDIPTCDA
jgi:hypothetical protein